MVLNSFIRKYTDVYKTKYCLTQTKRLDGSDFIRMDMQALVSCFSLPFLPWPPSCQECDSWRAVKTCKNGEQIALFLPCFEHAYNKVSFFKRFTRILIIMCQFLNCYTIAWNLAVCREPF